jgi:hypothetical protein
LNKVYRLKRIAQILIREFQQLKLRRKVMERKLCKEGARLETIYLQSAGERNSAGAAKRSFAGTSKGKAGVADRQRLSQRLEATKSARTKAQWAYIDHVVACSICNACQYQKRV